jgi:hypothetical protein
VLAGRNVVRKIDIEDRFDSPAENRETKVQYSAAQSAAILCKVPLRGHPDQG